MLLPPPISHFFALSQAGPELEMLTLTAMCRDARHGAPRLAFSPQCLAEGLSAAARSLAELSPGRPYLDAGISQCLQRGPDVGLQLVFHASQAQQLHLHLQALDHCGHLQRAVVHTQLGLDVAGLGNGEVRLQQTACRCCPGQLGLLKMTDSIYPFIWQRSLRETHSPLTGLREQS